EAAVRTAALNHVRCVLNYRAVPRLALPQPALHGEIARGWSYGIGTVISGACGSRVCFLHGGIPRRLGALRCRAAALLADRRALRHSLGYARSEIGMTDGQARHPRGRRRPGGP